MKRGARYCASVQLHLVLLTPYRRQHTSLVFILLPTNAANILMFLESIFLYFS